jgi:hypothetical protein
MKETEYGCNREGKHCPWYSNPQVHRGARNLSKNGRIGLRNGRFALKDGRIGLKDGRIGDVGLQNTAKHHKHKKQA